MFCKRCGDRTDAVFDIERDIVCLSAGERLRVRQERVAGRVEALEGSMRVERAKLSHHAEVAKAIDYMLKRWPAFTRFPEDGRILLDEQMPPSERYAVWRCAENRGCSPVGSAGPNEPPSCTPLIQTAKLNDIDPRRGSPIGRRLGSQSCCRGTGPPTTCQKAA